MRGTPNTQAQRPRGHLNHTVGNGLTGFHGTRNVNVRIGSQAWALWQFRGVSDAGVVQGNPLIGNALMDAVVENNGIQVHGKPGPWGYSLLVANPDDEGDMSGGRGFALGGKLYTALGAGFSVAGAYYQVHNDSDTTSGFAPHLGRRGLPLPQ